MTEEKHKWEVGMELDPGKHLNITESQYHSLPYLSSTRIKAAANNLASCLVPIEETNEMLLGKLIHSICLEGEETFDKAYIVEPDFGLNKNSNAYKEKRAEFESETVGRRIVPAKFNQVPTMDILNGVKKSLLEHPWSKALMKTGQEELTLIAHDPVTNEKLKARLDWYPEKLSIVDLKKTADISRFKYQLSSLHYDLQAGFYSMVSELCGMPVDTFFFIAVEANPPYPVLVGYLSEDRMAIANQEVSRLIGLIHEAREMNWWPAFKVPHEFMSLKQISESPRELLEVF